MNKVYLNYHCHSFYSKLDSTMNPKKYIDRLKADGMKAVCFSEHGNIGDWVLKWKMAKEAGLKYIHGVEMYLTKTLEEKIRDNFHVILIAKNLDGIHEINKAVGIATTDSHLYYNPRMTFDEFFNLSDNVIKISACLGGVLGDKTIMLSDEERARFIDSFDFLEIEPHMMDRQIEYNAMLKTLGKPLIIGTDTHELDAYGLECRAMLMKAKGQSYGYEDVLDLSYKTYDELFSLFQKQNIFTDEEIEEALQNTNVLESMCEDIDLDKSFKYPSSGYDNEEKTMMGKCLDRINKLDGINKEEYISRVNEEMESFNKVGMIGFMLYMYDISRFCRENNIPYGAGRGSVTGSLVAYLLEITDVNPIIWGTNFSRFVNDSRVSLGDIDCDYSPEDRDKVFNYIKNRSTIDNSCMIGTYTRLSVKSIIDMVGRALEIPLDEVATIKKGHEVFDREKNVLNRKLDNGDMSSYEYDIEIERIDKEEARYLSQFESIFHYYKGLNGVITAEGNHACGIVGSPINVWENLGIRYNKKNDRYISQTSMKGIDFLNFVKFDVLSLKTLQVIKHTCEMLGISIPKAHEINWNDEDVYNSMAVSPVGLFQMESDSTFNALKTFSPRNLKEVSVINAVVRPSCDSFRGEVLGRVMHETPSEAIGEILKESYGRLIYQEQIIEFLIKACGFSGQDADTVRKAIGKKDLVLLDSWLPKIESGYISNSDKKEEVAKLECQEFMKVMSDAGSYSFSYNHSIAYSMLTYITAYFRHYHPLEFISSYLNNASNEDDIVNGTILAKTLGVSIENPTYRGSGAKYRVYNGKIYKGIKSILHINDLCGEVFLNGPEADNIYDVLKYAKESKVNIRQLKILGSINFFSDFGKTKTIIKSIELFDKYYGSKRISKKDIKPSILCVLNSIMNEGVVGFKESPAQFAIDSEVFLKKLFSLLPNIELDKTDRFISQMSYLGYIQDDDLRDLKIGYIATNKSKNDSYKIDFVDGTSKWYEFSCPEPKKGDMIEVVLEATVKKEGSRFKSKVINNYKIIELDRIKR